MVELLTDAVMETVTEKRDEIADGVREFDWDVLAEKPVLLIFIDEETYSKHDDFEIIASVHEKGKPNETLYQRPRSVFKKIDFRPALNPPVKDKRDTLIYWAFQDMAGKFNITNDRLQSIADLKKALDQWEAARAGK
jgi:hypothetical protein